MDGFYLFKSTNQSFQISIAGHVQRMDSCYIGQRMRNLELRGRRERGRPQRWFMDAVKISLLTGRVLQQNQVQGRAAMCCEQPKVGWGWVGEWKEEESTETQGQNTNYRHAAVKGGGRSAQRMMGNSQQPEPIAAIKGRFGVT